MMKNTFWWGINLGTFVFPGFEVNSLIGLIFTCLGIFSFSILSEAIRAFLLSRAREVHLVPPDDNEARDPSARPQRRRHQESLQHHAVESVSYLLYITTSYILMLAVMSYNIPIFLSVIFGSGLGYFIFRNNYFNSQNDRNNMITDEGSTEPLTRDMSIEPGTSASSERLGREEYVREEDIESSTQINTSVIVHRTVDNPEV